MRAAVFTETGGPLSIEDLEPAPPGPRDVVVQLGASGVCHSDLSLKNGYVGIMPGTVLGHEGAGTVARGRQGSHARSRRATASSPRSSRRAASAGSACTTSRTSATPSSNVMMAMRGKRPDGSRVHGDDRPRHVRRGDDVRRVVDREGRHRRPRRAARADRLRRHHRRRRRAQHRRGAARLDRRGHRLRRRRPGGHPGLRASPAPSRIIAVDPVEMKRKTAEQLGATDFVDPNEGDPVAQVQQLTERPRRRLRVRGHRPARDDAPGVQHDPQGRHRGHGRHDPRRGRRSRIPTFDLFFNEKTLKGCKYGSGQVRRDFQRFADLIETGRLDTVVDGVAHDQARRGQRGVHARWRRAKSSARVITVVLTSCGVGHTASVQRPRARALRTHVAGEARARTA